MKDYKIRSIAKKDLKQFFELAKAHAEYEKACALNDNSLKKLENYFFNTDVVKCLVVESEETIVGYATCMKQFSTWDANFYIYLDCLFLNESTRGQGLGYQLMEKLKEYARVEGCDQVQWQTPEFNLDAIKFYKRLGAESKAKEQFFWNTEKN